MRTCPKCKIETDAWSPKGWCCKPCKAVEMRNYRKKLGADPRNRWKRFLFGSKQRDAA